MIQAILRRKVFDRLLDIKNGIPQVKYWRELEKSQYLPEETLLQRQWERLVGILEYVYENNIFFMNRFKEAGVKPSDIKAPENMSQIPILTKDDIRNNYDILISRRYNKKELMQAKTGGSTGKSLEIYFSEECSITRNACARRHDRWTGWEVGEPIGAVWGNPSLPTALKSKLKDALLQPYIYLDTMSVNEDSVKKFAQEWEETSPTLLFGHAHSLFLLAQFAIKYDITNIKPKGIIPTSMMLLPHERAVIEKTFGTRAFNRYGCEEVGLIASECEKHEGMHLNIDHLFIEFVKDDGSYAMPGEQGHIIVTDLVSRAMPFIRYKLEDLGTPLDRKCSCGRGLPLMGKITGRVADFLIKINGTKVAGISLIENTLTKIPGIEQMQIIQNDMENIVLNIVPGRDFARENEIELISYLDKVFESEMNIDLQKVSQLKQDRNGKYRFSICNVGNNHALSKQVN